MRLRSNFATFRAVDKIDFGENVIKATVLRNVRETDKKIRTQTATQTNWRQQNTAITLSKKRRRFSIFQLRCHSVWTCHYLPKNEHKFFVFH